MGKTDHILVEAIKVPYWGAKKRFDWLYGWGVSIKQRDVLEAEKLKINIRIPITYFKKTYEISGKNAKIFGEPLAMNRGGRTVELWCIPGDKLKVLGES